VPPPPYGAPPATRHPASHRRPLTPAAGPALNTTTPTRRPAQKTTAAIPGTSTRRPAPGRDRPRAHLPAARTTRRRTPHRLAARPAGHTRPMSFYLRGASQRPSPTGAQSSAPRRHSPFGPMSVPGQKPTGKGRRQKAKSGTCQGWVRNALTQPPLPIVAVSRNPSRETRLDRTRPTTGEGRHGPAAAAPQARRARGAPSAPQAPAGKTTRTTRPRPWHARPRRPNRATPPAKPGPHQSQARSRGNPGQAGSPSPQSQARVRNTCSEKRTSIPMQASSSHRTATRRTFEKYV
jgi:hypothetical protein